MKVLREIKFRAWDPERKQMWYGVEAWEDFCYIVYSQGEYHNWVLMQYTGLKDKNGKEIYEGDIIEHKYTGKSDGFCDCCGNYKEYTSTERNVYVVIFRNGKFTGVGDRIEHESIDTIQSEIEVIGNIYENHELLESQ